MTETVKSEWNMACPKCGSDDRIEIDADIRVLLTPDGTQDAGHGHFWEDDGAADCRACGFSGLVENFKIDGEDRE